MKKLLIAALFAVPFIRNGTLAVTDAAVSKGITADTIVKYITMEQGHKSKWFDFEKGHTDAKMDLIKKQHSEKMDLAKTHITKLGKGAPTNQYFADKLPAMISLHKKQMDEWKALTKHGKQKLVSLAKKSVLN